MIRPKNETENLSLSLTKICETLIKQTHRKAEETLEFKINKSKETFHFTPPLSIDGFWMLGLTSLEVYNFIFNITKEKIEFELYKFPDEKLLTFHTQQSEMKLKKTWIFQILQPPIYKMI